MRLRLSWLAPLPAAASCTCLPALAFCTFLLAMASCSRDFDFRQREAVAGISVSTDRLDFGAGAGSDSVTVVSTQTWTAGLRSPDDWLSFSCRESGIRLEVKDNPDVSARSATLDLHAGDRSVSILVRQAGREAHVLVSADTLALGCESCSRDIAVESDVAWTAYAPASWLTASVSGGTLTVGCTQNSGASRRSSYVLLQNKGVSLKRIFVSQASSAPPVPEYYRIDLDTVDWKMSKVFYVTGGGADTIAVLTKEYLGVADGRVKECLYPWRDGRPDFDAATLSASGSFWIRRDGSAFFTSNPATVFDEVEQASLEALRLVSDVKSHGAVKVGTQIWLAEDYKTKSLADGTQIPVYSAGQAFWASGSKACAVTESGGADHYLYTGYCVEGIAPEGWAVPTQEDYLQTLLTFAPRYALLAGDSQFGATSNFKCTASGGKVSFTALNYTNTWTSVRSGTSKMFMAGKKPDDTNVNSAQNLTACFSIRLIKAQ